MTLSASSSSSGGRANSAGRSAEYVILDFLNRKGYTVEYQYPAGTNIYGGRLNIDVFCTGIPQFPNGLAIESKWQSTGGSVDEKLPYLIANIQEKYPCPAVIVVAGGGTRPGAILWAKAKIDGQKLINVLSLEEFMAWVMREL
jgi:hypothetical protein